MENTGNNGQYADINGIKMYYEIHGEGHPLVLIHGGGSTIGTSFGAILPTLSKTHRVIAVELQNHGHTGDRNAPETFEQDANDVAELLRQLGIAEADIFGFSNGGQTALQLGIKHPEKVRKLVIASAFYSREGAFEGFWDGFPSATLSNMPQVYQDEFLKINNGDTAALRNMFNKDVQRMENFKGWTDDDMCSITAPALIVSGDRDVATLEHTIKMCRLIPNSRPLILPATHGSYMGEAMTPNTGSKMPEFFVEVVNEFLAE